MVIFLASLQSKIRGGHKNYSRRDLKCLEGEDWLATFGCNIWGEGRGGSSERKLYIYPLGEVEAMEISQAGAVLEGIRPVGTVCGG